MIKTIENINVKNKKVILRVDYNVSIVDDTIVNTKKIDDTFKTIDYLIKQNASIILLSHFGRVKAKSDMEKNSLKPVYEYIKSLKKYDILFSSEPIGEMLDNICKNLKPKQLVLVENTRFLDLQGNLESGCDTQLAMYYSELADVYIDEAFGCMHRNHASITGIPKFMPSAVGFLVANELTNLSKVVHNQEHPFTVLMGGAKLEDKIELIYTLAEYADYILLGGGIANTFLKANGFNVGASLYSKECLQTAKNIMIEFPDKIILPKDVIVNTTYNKNTYELKKVTDILEDDVIGDIGSGAISNYKRILESSKTIFINGTVGMYEKKEFSNGTNEILNIASKASGFKVVGGGDALSALKKFHYEDKMDFVSTGGGATLKYIADSNLVGLKAIEDAYEEDID